MDFFILKKIVSRLFFPLPLCIELMGIGLVLHLFSRKKKTASLFLGCGFLLLILFSLQGPSNLLLCPLESIYKPAFSKISSTHVLPKIHWIVVLGGDTLSAKNRPANSSLGTSSLARIVEGVRLARIFPRAHLILTGSGGPGDPDSTAGLMARTAISLGINASRITRIGQAKDTPDEARMTARIIPPTDRLILVTSASHLPRAMRLFQKQGLSPIPAPAFFLSKKTSRQSVMNFIPSARNLQRSERAIYEYMGLLWSSLRHLI